MRPPSTRWSTDPQSNGRPATSKESGGRRAMPWRSGTEEDLDGLPGVHRLVAGRGLVQRKLEVEHLAGVDLPVPNYVDELRQESADRGRAAMQVDAGEEQLRDGQFGVVEHADVPEVAAG